MAPKRIVRVRVLAAPEGERPEQPAGQEVSIPARRHRGDIMSPETRSRVMAKIRGRDTGPERVVAAGLTALGFLFETMPAIFRAAPILFCARSSSPSSSTAISGTAIDSPSGATSSPRLGAEDRGQPQRDTRNFRLLRAQGWKVVRLWEHQLDRNAKACLRRVAKIIAERTVVSL